MSDDIKQQAVTFWNSPWAMQTEWTNGRDLRARFFLDNELLMLEVSGAHLLTPKTLTVQGTELTLTGDTGDEPPYRIPLPSAVKKWGPETVMPVHGMLQISLQRALKDGDLA